MIFTKHKFARYWSPIWDCLKNINNPSIINLFNFNSHKIWCHWWESNPHDVLTSTDFKSVAYACSATMAYNYSTNETCSARMPLGVLVVSNVTFIPGLKSLMKHPTSPET